LLKNLWKENYSVKNIAKSIFLNHFLYFFGFIKKKAQKNEVTIYTLPH